MNAVTAPLAQLDGVGLVILVALVAMSLTTWYLLLSKVWLLLRQRQASQRFLGFFWGAPSLDAVEQHLAENHPDEPFSHLAWHGIVAARHHQRHGQTRLADAGSAHEYVGRALQSVLDEETTRSESGLTILASIAATAPFIGLFGTVWGVYHALAAIGASGEAGLQQVAGPVGEALIMTAIGLAVAIPAVLAYNTLTRRNRVMLARLEKFGHQVHAFLTTGERMPSDATRLRAA